jgi:hypothetical protein
MCLRYCCEATTPTSCSRGSPICSKKTNRGSKLKKQNKDEGNYLFHHCQGVMLACSSILTMHSIKCTTNLFHEHFVAMRDLSCDDIEVVFGIVDILASYCSYCINRTTNFTNSEAELLCGEVDEAKLKLVKLLFFHLKPFFGK